MGIHLSAVSRLSFLSLLCLAGCGSDFGTMTMGSDFCDGYIPAGDSKLVFPFVVGKSIRVGQGNCGPVTHTSVTRYAYDFTADSGEPIYAVLGGVVLGVEGNIGDGHAASGAVNYIYVKHVDGSVASYVHVKKGTLLVAKNDQVYQGQQIAENGASGTGGPHLHFQVFKSESRSETIPVTFKNVGAGDYGLQVKNSYSASTYIPSETVLVSAKMFKGSSTCSLDGGNLSASAPSLTGLSESSKEENASVSAVDSNSLSVECAYAGAAANSVVLLASFDTSAFRLDGTASLQLAWKAAAGSYASSCSSSTSLATGGGASPPLRNIQVWRYNSGQAPAWQDVSTLGTTSISGEYNSGSPSLFQNSDGKIWIRIVGGNPGVAAQCSSILLDYLKLTINPL